jgi:hypothetical protein
MRIGLASILFWVATAACAQDLKKFEFEPPVQPARDGKPAGRCAFDNLSIPTGMRVYAAGGYSGRVLQFQIDQSGHEATQFDIAVNSPGKPVALLLGAYEPTIWNIGWTRGTRIVAVLVSGYHRQAVAGLEKSVPVLNSSYDNKGPCGYFYVGNGQNTALNPQSRKVFNQQVDMVFPGDRKGKIVVGDPLAAGADLVTSGATSPESFRDSSAPLAGQAGLDSAVAKGVLRLATTADGDAWVAAVKAATGPADVPPVAGQGVPGPTRPRMHNAYVVLGAFTYPSGLYGANSATFFIARGVPKPSGNPGHSSVYDFNSLVCRGPLCER